MTFSDLEEEFGVKRVEAEESLDRLVRTGLIRPKMLHTRLAIGVKRPKYEFELTLRGEYYIHYMVHWDSYIARYGVSRHQEEYESKEVRNRVEIELLKFLASICVIVQKNRPKPVDFKINKVRLSETFSSHRRAYLLSLNQTNKRESLSMTPSILEEYFKNRLGIIAVHKLDDNRNFLFYPDDISKILHSRGIPMSYHDIFDEAQFEKQILEIVEYPDYV